MLSILGWICHFTTPSGLLSLPARSHLYGVGQAILLRHLDFSVDRLEVIFTGSDMSFYYVIRTFKLTGFKLSLPGWTCHFTTPSGLLSGPVRCCLYQVEHVILLRNSNF